MTLGKVEEETETVDQK